jgi:hypothetical protein
VNASILLTLLLMVAVAPEQLKVRLRTAPAVVVGDEFMWNTHMTIPCGFLMPNNGLHEKSGLAMAYRASTDTLFVTTEKEGTGSKVMEITTPNCGTTTVIGSMVRAVQEQAPNDLTDGNMLGIVGADNLPVVELGQYRNRGLYVFDNLLCSTAYLFYDNGDQVANAFCHSLVLNSDTFDGWKTLWQPANPRHPAGPITDIPAAWQAALGGTHLAMGPTDASIITRQCAGLGVFAFTPANLTGAADYATVTAQPLVCYDTTHPMTIGYDTTAKILPANTLWTRATTFGGCFIPEGFDELACVGVHGVGPYCYGSPTTDPLRHAELVNPDPATYLCYNLAPDANQGDHAYPFVYYWWGYRLSDLAAAKTRNTDFWDVRPYAYGEITNIPYTPPADAYAKALSLAYVRAEKRLYLSQYRVEEPGTVGWPAFWNGTHP